jgi:hypothetical protein
MKDWKEELNKKAKEFNITEKGDSDVHIRTDNRINNRTDNRRTSGSVHISTNSETKELNKVNMKGGGLMITVEGGLKDLEAIEATTTDAGAKAIIQALKVMLKFLSTMRSNQLLTEEDKVRIKKEKENRKPRPQA